MLYCAEYSFTFLNNSVILIFTTKNHVGMVYIISKYTQFKVNLLNIRQIFE